MKKRVFFRTIFTILLFGGVQFSSAQTTNQSSHPIRLNSGTELLIAETDYYTKTTRVSAMQICSKMGNDWRLPSVDELEEIFEYQNLHSSSENGFEPLRNISYWSKEIHMGSKGDDKILYVNFLKRHEIRFRKAGEEGKLVYLDIKNDSKVRKTSISSKKRMYIRCVKETNVR